MRRRLLVVAGLALLTACSSNDAPERGASAAAADRSESATGTSASAPASQAPASPSEAPAPDAAVLAPDVISTRAEEYRISLAPDGLTAYFARGDGFFPQSRAATIYETTLVDGQWSEPVVAPFSGTHADIDPWVAPDGDSIYFSSTRPVEGESRGDAEVWRVDREGDAWGEPVHIAVVGSTFDELGASVDADGILWFASDRPGGSGGWDLYTAQPTEDGGFGDPEPVASLNSAVWEFNPAISADGATLVFTSINRAGGIGLGDLFRTRRDGASWSEPEPLAVNTSADEYHPSLSPDGATLYFVRRAAQGDLHETPVE